MTLAASRIWIQADDETVHAFECCGGTAVGYSKPCPGKTTPNEDAAGIFFVTPDSAVFAVADGMGGANCGDRASQTVIQTLQRHIESVTSENLQADRTQFLRGAVLDAIEEANQLILDWGIGAGTTLAVAIYCDGVIRSFHVGDAMILLCSNRGRSKFTTVAHSPVAMAVEIGVLEESEAIVHEDRNLISNCVGSSEMRIEIGPPVNMSPRDSLIVSSDGLFDNLLPDEIIDLIRVGKLDLQAANLFEIAGRRMVSTSGEHPAKPDDLTTICFRQR